MPETKSEMKFLGSSKVSSKLRISLVKDAADLMGINDGDHILFYEGEKGQVFIKKG
ncbi:MAG TPA: hypothetical protein VGK23_01070 [Methanomassiliicoccales archaeon]|jgi:bifunctional DNA-binding transcriptional regulator/antitoxin component of YhaV-PrlF toxin-antitoxin module